MYELLQMMQSFCEKLLQQKQAASIDKSPLQEMSIQDMEDLKQHYLDEMLSLSNDFRFKDVISDSESDLPSCDDFYFSPINVSEEKSVTFSNPLFDSNDDFTFSDDESLSDEDVPKDNVKIYSNPLFKFDDEYISSDINPLFDEVLEDIESKDSYDSNLDEPALLVTHFSDTNEDECFDLGENINEIKACLTSNSIPLGIDDADFDPEGDILLLEKLLNDDPSSPLPPKELYFEDLKLINSSIDTSQDFEDDYYDSEGDIIYLESLLIKDTIPNLPPEVILDHDPKSLKDELDKEDLKSMVKVFARDS
ncbi:hypothetical protein Tco_1300532 [Tanacetum coccineum]